MNVDLGSAGSFAVLAGSTVTNTGSTLVYGNLGVWPGSAVTGFPPGIVAAGAMYAGDATAEAAQADLVNAYAFAAAETGSMSLTGQDLGGMTLTPGVYSFSSSAQLTGALTLNGEGDPNAVFVFQIGSTLTTADDALVSFVNGAYGAHVFWQVGSSATLGADTAFLGNIMALTSITLDTGSAIGCGSALAINGAVTMDSNNVSVAETSCGLDAIPEPRSAAFFGPGILLVLSCLGVRRTARRVASS